MSQIGWGGPSVSNIAWSDDHNWREGAWCDTEDHISTVSDLELLGPPLSDMGRIEGLWDVMDEVPLTSLDKLLEESDPLQCLKNDCMWPPGQSYVPDMSLSVMALGAELATNTDMEIDEDMMDEMEQENVLERDLPGKGKTKKVIVQKCMSLLKRSDPDEEDPQNMRIARVSEVTGQMYRKPPALPSPPARTTSVYLDHDYDLKQEPLPNPEELGIMTPPNSG